MSLQDNTPEQIINLYNAIELVKDASTRKVLYSQFLAEYFPKAVKEGFL